MTQATFHRYPAEIDLERLLSPQAARSSEYQAVWDWMQEQDKRLPDQSRMSIPEQREIRKITTGRWNADPPRMARVESVLAPGFDGGPPVACELHVPFEARPGAVLYLHGGGWVFGDLRSHVRLARNVAVATRRAVLVADYRLAPEHRYPAALDDARAAWRWLAAAGGSDPALDGPLAIAGDSAGANLGVGVMTAERGRTRAEPICGLYFYGVFAGDVNSPSYLRFGAGHGLARGGMEKYWRMYAGEPGADGRWRDPLLSPIDADEATLAALPPLHLAAAQLDPLLCDTLAFAQRLREAGGACECAVHEGVHHGFVQITSRLAAARDAIERAGAFMSARLGEA